MKFSAPGQRQPPGYTRAVEAIALSNTALLIGALLVLAGIVSSVLASRFGAPLLLVFLVLGMLAGEEGLLGIAFRDLSAAYALGALALAVILFDGGLRTRLKALREVLAPAFLLATVGVVLTALLTALAARALLALGWVESLLVGSVIASTDAAAVFFLLRAGGLHLNRKVASTLEVESGSNDPMAVFLTLFLVGLLLAPEGGSPLAALGFFLGQLLLGLALGLIGGLALVAALNRLPLPGGLHPVFAVAAAVAIFALTNALSGSGFLAAYVAGLVVGNRPVRDFASVLNLQDAATWLAQIVMFLVLGLLASPAKLAQHLLPALGVAAFLMFIARPLAVWPCLWPFRYAWRERLFIAWVGLRGAVGIFLASIPLLVGLPEGSVYFDVAFVVVLASLIVQGWTLRPVARALGVALPRLDPAIERVELDLPGQLGLELVGYPVAPEAAILKGGKLPRSARLALVVREGQVLMPEEAGAIRAGDRVYFLAPPGRVARLDWLFAPPAEAALAERELFGAFLFDAGLPLGEIADYYGLKLPEALRGRTAAELFAERYEEQVQVGDAIELPGALLTVRETDEERVTRVGLKFVAGSA